MGPKLERKSVYVCTKSKLISKKSNSKNVISAKVAEIASSRTPVPPKDVVVSGESIDKKEFLNKDNSESQQLQSFSLDSSFPERMESANSYEPKDAHFLHYTEEDAGSIGDIDMATLRADEYDGGRSICGYETCDVSDFYVSDMTIPSLPFDGDSFDDDIYQFNYLCDYRSSEPTICDASDQYMVLPALEVEDDVKIGKTSDIISFEEAMVVRENASLYSALCCNQDSDFKNDLDKADFFDPQLFIKNFPELSDIEWSDLFNEIPKQSQRRKSVTLVLDLDETLVHSTLKHCDDPDFSFTVFYNMKEHTVNVKQRPNLHPFLERVSEMFEVVIFTASQSIYAKQLLDILDPDGRLISRREYRESCTYSDGKCTKDLTVLGVDLAKVAIIDNTPEVFRLQVNNGIPIKSWFDDPLDCALMSLLPFLEILADADDVRPIIAQRFGNKE